MKRANLDTDLKYIEDPVILQNHLAYLMRSCDEAQTNLVKIRDEYLHRMAKRYKE